MYLYLIIYIMINCGIWDKGTTSLRISGKVPTPGWFFDGYISDISVLLASICFFLKQSIVQIFSTKLWYLPVILQHNFHGISSYQQISMDESHLPGAPPRRKGAAEACADASAERGELPQGDRKQWPKSTSWLFGS